jgi:amino acid adenylation domain-containing protein/non-ribosomal peptide synthase protein (TIGR01720 family)
MTPGQATDPAYWARHLCAPVQVQAALETLAAAGPPLAVEVGPGFSLGSLLLQGGDHAATRLVVPTLPASDAPQSALATILSSLAQLWLSGVPVDWAAVHAPFPRRRIPLPTYPFERQRYWIDPVTSDAAGHTQPTTDTDNVTHGVTLTQHVRPNLANPYVAPARPLEHALITIWSKLLGIEPIGIHDNFFAMGGHSLLATQIVTAIRDQFQVDLPLRTLFEAPTVAELATLVEQAQQATTGQQTPILVPVARDGVLPLSFAQERLWFLDQLVPHNPAYHIAAAVRLEGSLAVAALEATLNQIVRRHEALRTTIRVIDGQPAQVIAPTLTIDLPIVDLQTLPADNQEAEIGRLATAEAQKPFDLAHGPLLRGVLFKLNPQAHVLLLTMHHIIGDGWSGGVLVQELAALYPAFIAGDHAAASQRLPDLPIQYADYAVWQREWLQGAVLDDQLGYWKRQLANVPILELPTDRPRPAIQTFHGATHRFLLAKPLAEALTTLSQREDVTLFMTLLAAFQVLLARYSEQDDIAVGTTVANRTRAELEGLIGCFVNTVVMRTDLAGNPSFRDVLQRVRDVALGAYSHQEVPFERVVEAVQPRRDLSHNPLFQVVFVLQNTPMPAVDLPDVSLREQPIETGTAQFDLVLNLTETADGLKGWLDYNTDLFEAATIARLVAHFQKLLEGVTAHPERAIAEFPLLTAAEHQMLRAWNATTEHYPTDRCIQQLVEAQAAQRPDAIAVVDGVHTLTYGELNRRANQVAHYLHTFGLKPEASVAVCLERSANLIVSLLGILKAGAAYVPLDPATPPIRLQFMLEDAQAAIVLTQKSLVSALPNHGARPICLDSDWPLIRQQPTSNPTNRVNSEQLAYIIYTSGSTGQPKGVQIEHRGLLNLVYWYQRAFNVSCEDRASQVAGLAFDASVVEIWPNLAAGACLYFPDADTRLSDVRLRDWLIAQQITIAFVPTPLAEQMIRLEWPEAVRLRTVLTGGDQLYQYPPSTLPFALNNNYGPTENTVIATSGYVPPLEDADHAPDLGRPITNVQVYILDRWLQPVPVGVPGEIYVAGQGVARGYLNRPDLTAERFIPHPFSNPEDTQPGARLYRTGDRARYHADGTLEFLGRGDTQIKVRGYRIEPGEIEVVLNTHPQVRQAVVVACEEQLSAGDRPHKRLVAYVVAEQQNTEQQNTEQQNTEHSESQEEIGSVELRVFLQERLPEYMVPNAFVILDELPLTANGKVDRRALPAPERVMAQEPFVSPRTEAERQLTQIWIDLLGREQVSIHDNFFALGGDSILSMQIIARAAQVGLRLTPRQIFQYQTIAELAAVAAADGPMTEQAAPAGDVPLTPIQRWFFAQNITTRHHWNLALLLEVPPALDVERLATALDHLSRHHDALRLRFFRESAGWRQTSTGSEAAIPCQVFDLMHLSAAEQTAAIEAHAIELQASLDLQAGPLMRVAYFNQGIEQPGRLLIVAHHLIIDGVSWRILLEDLATAYEQVSRGEPVVLPPKTTPYQRWAERLQAYAQTPELRAEWAYWREALPTQIARLPCDHVRGNNTQASAALVTRQLDATQTELLLRDIHQAYQTRIEDVLLTAMYLTLAPWIDSSAVLVDIDRHGRVDLFDDIDLSRTVGWFTAIVPVLLDVEQPGEIASGLQAVKTQLQRIPRSGIGYGMLRFLSGATEIVDYVESLPQAEVNFNYLGQIDPVFGGNLLLGLANESIGPTRSPESLRQYLIEINVVVVDKQLQVTWIYSTNRHQPATIERLAEHFMHALSMITDHCLIGQRG